MKALVCTAADAAESKFKHDRHESSETGCGVPDTYLALANTGEVILSINIQQQQ